MLGVDKTFNLCDMHVTVTCYKQLTVNRHKTREPPIFFGPMFLHDNSDFETYAQFFNHLKVKLINCDLDGLTIGSDDEKALVKAATTSFHEATHILCTRHLRQNANQKLTDDAVNKKDKDKILGRIFGDGGIIDADDDICFDEKCDNLVDLIDGLSTRFTTYFNTRLRPILQKKMNEPRNTKGLDRRWTNNNWESMNHVLKQTIDWKSQPLTDLVTKLHRLVDGQFNDLRAALVGTGEFRLADSH